MLIVEAMKMEYTLSAPRAAGSRRVCTASVGDQVLVDAPLVELEPESGDGRRMNAPLPTPLADLPDRVRIYEVGPRDGLQNEDTVVPVEVKAEFIRRLADSGLEAIELTSFVPPSWIPQLG